MTDASRAYRRTHDPEAEFDAVLPVMRAHAGPGMPRDAAAVAKIAREVHLPVAHVRGALSSYGQWHEPKQAIRVCAGTSCMMAGGAGIAAYLHEHAGQSGGAECEPVYCLGYCDRSPVAMSAAGKVVAGVCSASIASLFGSVEPAHPAPPVIRNVAKHAVITERLLEAAVVDECPEYAGLVRALAMKPAEVTDAVLAAGVRGRGGAAYPTGSKWRLATAAPGNLKFVVANGDEGDPGSFIDRELMERDPHGILEGMAICAHAVGASRGVVFIRAEYPVAVAVMSRAIRAATASGFLGDHALGHGKPFEVEVVQGMGSYVCGEETALLNAIEGRRGEVNPRPPYPVQSGLFGCPTVVDNVETLVNIPWIMVHGAPAFAAMGNADSKGTKAMCLNRGFAKPGIVEVEFGITLRDVIEKLGGGGADGRELEAVLIGGPMGSIVTPDQWDTPVCFTAMAKAGINLGHGGLVAIARPADWSGLLRHLLAFMKEESCGKCVPCRLGSTRAQEMGKAGLTRENLPEFEKIMELMKVASLCAFGRETPGPVRTIIEKFGQRIIKEARQ